MIYDEINKKKKQENTMQLVHLEEIIVDILILLLLYCYSIKL